MAEDAVAGALRSCGFSFRRQVFLDRTLYRERRCVDFLVSGMRGFSAGLVIESKWQDRSGSVDEKFPYLVGTIKVGTYPTIVIAGGHGCKPAAFQWLRAQCDGVRLVHVFTVEEFLRWLRRQANQ